MTAAMNIRTETPQTQTKAEELIRTPSQQSLPETVSPSGTRHKMGLVAVLQLRIWC